MLQVHHQMIFYLRFYRAKYRSDKEFKKAVADYITFYNTQRPHLNNNYRTPDAKEADYYSNFSN